ncbi:uncharacterized protein BYT42DRAFT_566459 [Radiomyces spectabilis]|uniref:uncharacterized protein n=1 Tax=Radiomyces spectabilis TaxID=64574 RepID=UPI00221FDD65|nr:uncharacterized protein BYT42DRAFT_566459 [Radiomyces spectabilis]KAI8381419.1 hypothetical protein BYT42DRAFT_566459 [Radiomyces spectabilis]
MGATQSKSEPIIFYNQNVPLQFSQGLVDSLEARKPKSAATDAPKARPEEIEAIVRQRVEEELKRAQQQQEEVNKRAYNELSKKNIENDHNSVVMNSDIETMIQRIKRSPAKEVPAEIIERQEAVVLCYKNNQSRPLDCWEEVEAFKESVTEAQRKFVAAHQ